MDMDQDGSDDAPARAPDDAPAPARGGAEGDPRRRSGAAPGRAGAVDRQHGAVIDELGRQIATGRRPADSIMTVAGLEADFGVSRTVVREVVKVLESLGSGSSAASASPSSRAPPGTCSIRGSYAGACRILGSAARTSSR